MHKVSPESNTSKPAKESRLPAMTASDIVWGGLLLTGAAFEVWALANRQEGDTLSESTRKAFRVRTSKTGRAAFAGVWSAFSFWYLVHILYDVPFPGF